MINLNIHRLKYLLIERPYYTIKYAYQRVVRGYDDTARWGLCDYIAEISIPILKEYRDNGNWEPGNLTEQSWEDALTKMLVAMELIKSGGFLVHSGFDKKAYKLEQKKIKEGLTLFAKYFQYLWN